ncbi:MAG TPA: cytochrome c [Acidimicrobiia bacterium]|nr:cytochrome c [Acidimicrobiia bacterium]
MSDLSAAAAALGVPEAIVKRSAEARAKATGATVDEVLTAWAGGAPAPAAQEPTTEPAAPPPPPEERPETPEPAEEAPAASAAVTTSESHVARPTSHVSEAPPPREVSPKEAVRYPVVVAFPTAGLKERTRSTVPWWLAATFIIVPLFGLLQLAGAATNECGVGTELLPDRVTGELRNCDGTEFEGRGPAGGGTDFLGVGGGLYAASPGACQGCHGAEGQGGVGPAMSNVVATFSSCLDHIEWVEKGTQGFQAEGRTGYGDGNKPFGSVIMPAFGSTLSPEQLAAVVAFERVRFGGQPRDEALVDCGLAEVPAEEGEGAAEPGAEGETTTTTQAP